MVLKKFAEMLHGRQYRYPQFTKEEIQIAKDNNFVIVYGASDDLVEFDGAITDEGDCWEGGKILVEAIPGGGVVDGAVKTPTFLFHLEIKWCKDKDENGNIISWTYNVPIEHENFMIYEDEKPYCRGFVFKV